MLGCLLEQVHLLMLLTLIEKCVWKAQNIHQSTTLFHFRFEILTSVCISWRLLQNVNLVIITIFFSPILDEKAFYAFSSQVHGVSTKGTFSSFLVLRPSAGRQHRCVSCVGFQSSSSRQVFFFGQHR